MSAVRMLTFDGADSPPSIQLALLCPTIFSEITIFFSIIFLWLSSLSVPFSPDFFCPIFQLLIVQDGTLHRYFAAPPNSFYPKYWPPSTESEAVLSSFTPRHIPQYQTFSPLILSCRPPTGKLPPPPSPSRHQA